MRRQELVPPGWWGEQVAPVASPWPDRRCPGPLAGPWTRHDEPGPDLRWLGLLIVLGSAVATGYLLALVVGS